MNRKGQALVEFVLILPVFIFLLFAVYDFGMIFNTKNKLENDSTDIALLYKNGTSIDEIRNMYPKINIEVTNENDYDNVIIKGNVKIITPGLNRILGNPYKVYVKRYIPHE
jgi:Flp pilus assembly protein TadG